MPKHEALNNVTHKDVKVIFDRHERFGDKVMGAYVFPNEFRDVQSTYPILFSKTQDTGDFFAMALFGFEQGENLFLTEAGWDAVYVPLVLEKGPFAIGRQKDEQSGEEAGILTIDLDHPRVAEEGGEPLFLEFGGNSPALEKITKVMDKLHDGHGVNAAFIKKLLDLDLLTTLNLDITLDDGQQHRLSGYYIIDEEKLRWLEADVVKEMNETGFLEAIFMVIASLSNLQALVNKKNKMLAV